MPANIPDHTKAAPINLYRRKSGRQRLPINPPAAIILGHRKSANRHGNF